MSREPSTSDRPGAFVTRFRPGPPFHVPGLGLLPGTPYSLLPFTGGAVYVIDDAHAGEVYTQGTTTITLISMACALSWMSANTPTAQATAAASPAPPSPAEWLSTTQAADAIGTSPWALENVRKQAPADLPNSPHPHDPSQVVSMTC